jgi:hypothetical protein
MDKDTGKLIADQLATLPISLQRAIAQTPWRNMVADIAKANNLGADKSEALAMEAMFVMYGFENQRDLAANIARELQVDPSRARMLDDEINLKVFSVVLARANDLENQKGEETLQSAPELQTTGSKQPTTLKPSINLIPPKPEVKPIDLLSSTFPKATEEKLTGPVIVPPQKNTYPDGKDPYREPI